MVIISAVRDITERIQMEEQLRHAHRIDAMGQLTGGLAHDFNNLLGVIIGNLDVIAARKIAGVTTFVDNALEAADRGAMLVKQLLAFARKQPLQPERISVQERSLKTVTLLESALGSKIKIQHSVDPETLPIVADRSQLEAALLNLAVNARDAMPGGGTLTLECTNVALDEDYASTRVDVKPGEYVMIAVSDTGIGMPPETQAKVFEPFFTTKGANGTGLGLSQVFGFAKQSGGHVSVYSEVGIGTTFRLYLPPAPASTRLRANARNVSPAGRSGVEHGKETILVVDDNDAMREVAAMQLHTLGYDVIVADSPNDALDVLRSPRNVDLLLTDIVMPGQLDGRELALRARELRPALNVLFTSGFTESTLAASISADFAGHILSKPYRQVDLAKRLRDLFDTVEATLTVGERRLLAIDDEKGLLAVVQDVAESAGYEVVATSDPTFFLQQSRDWQPTLVLMDLQMPDVDGVELLRAMADDKLKAPIMLMSGVEDKVLRTVGDLGSDLGLNMRGVLAKPIRMETFRRALEEDAAPNGGDRAEELRTAIATGQLVLHYQPVIRLASRELIAFEALVRWNHPQEGLIQPDHFVPLAEEHGLIDDLTWVVMRMAVEQAARWAETLAVPIAVNLSATNLNDEAFPDKLARMCREHGVTPEQIYLELTETATTRDTKRLKAILSRIRLKGFRLAIDDFGIGYSSMMQLRSLPFSTLKIDKSFVQDMLQSEDAGIIVNAILALAGAFRMDVVAEGIETEAQLSALIARGAVSGQGYLIARPAPADDISRRFTPVRAEGTA